MRIILTIATLILGHLALGQARFVNPVEGIVGEDYIIVNYVDWGASSTVLDNHCLSKSYNGHQGTDYTLKSFRQMDEGVNVVAVDTGVVIFTHDGEFDREKVSVISKGLGNYVGITHSGDFQTYYGHLKKNSIVVNVGDTVLPGQVIGQIASSGNSTDPHLHFELWYDSTYYIDPFAGPCGNAGTYWITPEPFDSSFFVWNASIWNGFPTLDTLREEPLRVDTIERTDEYITYWSLSQGMRPGDSISTEWVMPNGEFWTSWNFEIAQDWWYYYFWSYLIVEDSMPSGEWTVNWYRNGNQVDQQNFVIRDTVTISDTTDSTVGLDRRLLENKIWYHSGNLYSEVQEPLTVDVYSLLGIKVTQARIAPMTSLHIGDMRTGVYLLVVSDNEGRTRTLKALVE